ncbi:Uma2 family endonuclease [bacterium]|nr:Uma2 family endonuclease [bacterium]
MGAASTATMTAGEFCDWVVREHLDGRAYELVRGEVSEVPPPTRLHGLCCWLVIKVLTEYVGRRGAGHLLTNDAGILVEENPDTLRGADVILFLRNPAPQDFAGQYVTDVPDLVVEIVSPSDRKKDINLRVNQYLDRGIPLVWLIDPDDRLVTVCRPRAFPKALDATEELTGSDVLPDFACPVRVLFPPTPTP